MSLNQKRDESGTKMIPIEFIEIAPGRRALRPLVVERFAASMTDIGLRTPITVRYFPRSADRGTPNSYLLVVGAHRLAAARLLGWREIRAFVITGDDIKDSDVELWEIDENLMRAEPDAAEHALLTKRRAEIMEAKAQEEAVSQSATPLSKQARRGKGQKTGRDTASIRDQAERTGESKDKIARSRKRGEKLGNDTLRRVTGTSVGKKGSELDALGKLAPLDIHEQALIALLKGIRDIASR